MIRSDGRRPDELRPLDIKRRYLKQAEGSALISMGDTVVLCAATVEERVPPFLKGTGYGWVTAEYAMLPRSTKERIVRDAAKLKIGGRNHEIMRLIGRSLRAVTDTAVLGERNIIIDCDVIQADGGTRTASITGAFIALWDACRFLLDKGVIPDNPICDYLAAISVGMVNGELLLDLNYGEDSAAQVDMNIVMTGGGRFVEIQGTAEHKTFSENEMIGLIAMARAGIDRLLELERQMVGVISPREIHGTSAALDD